MTTQFTIEADEGFYITVADDITVYEAYEDAVAELQSKLAADTDGFLAEVAIDRTADADDVAVTLEQVGWQRIIRDMDDGGSTTRTADTNPPGGGSR